jgi:hypothetical protein
MESLPGVRAQHTYLRDELNVRSTFRFNALMTPIRANIVGPPGRRDQDQRFHSCLPLRGLVLDLQKLRNVIASVLERDEASAARQRYWVLEPSLPTAISRHAAA